MGVAREGIGAADRVNLGVSVEDVVAWSARVHWRLEKRRGGIEDFGGDRERFMREVEPYEVLEFDRNELVNIGGEAIWDLVTGLGTYTAFNNSNAYLGVGDSSTAWNATQTDLQAATNKLRKGMNGSYPSISVMVVTFQSDFGSTEANWTWNEVGTFNAASGAQMLNRKVQALGTKSAGTTWTLTETITLS